MRTRLDEILESFFGTAEKPVLYPDGARAAVRASLDHAFRHGVEQAWADCKRMIDKEVPTTDDLIYKYSHKTPVSAVQPAPAGEKCPWTFAAQMPCDKPNGHDGAHGPAGEEKPRHIGVDAGGRIDHRDNPEGQYRAGEIARHIRERVQPAPAREKGHPFGCQPGCCIDRRKGERRKGLGTWCPCGCSVMYPDLSYGPDRRSGKDRRK